MKKNSSHPKRPRLLSTQEIDEAITEVASLARSERILIALAGGAAMGFYGSDRNTSDIDFIVDSMIDALPAGPLLSFGGQSTCTSEGVTVDLILRDDNMAPLYEDALLYARREPGCPAPILTPEHLIVIKINAGRPKDLTDVAFLLENVETNVQRTLKIARDFLHSDEVVDLRRMLKERGLLPKNNRR